MGIGKVNKSKHRTLKTLARFSVRCLRRYVFLESAGMSPR
jgi:hypothetical protein